MAKPTVKIMVSPAVAKRLADDRQGLKETEANQVLERMLGISKKTAGKKMNGTTGKARKGRPPASATPAPVRSAATSM